MSTPLAELDSRYGAVSLRNDRMEVVVLANKGADIYSIIDGRTGVDVLFKAPWGAPTPGQWRNASTSMEHWVGSYAGGWQVLLPNGGDECVEQNATWGYHGEAALVPWNVINASATTVTLETRLLSVPLKVRREISLDGPVMRLRESLTNESVDRVEVMWVHHPAFGAPFLDGDCIISAGCRSVWADDRSPGTLMSPDSRHSWPMITTVSGERIDLRHVPSADEHRAVLAYLGDFDAGYFAITNPNLHLGIGFRWPLDVFDKAWLWQEVFATTGWPWFSGAYAVAIEPASTVPGQGMTRARARGSTGIEIDGLTTREVVMEVVLFDGTGEVSGIDQGGEVSFVKS